MRTYQVGLTLVELLITVAVVAVMAALAAPDFRAFLVKQSVNTTAQALVEDIRLTRVEAVKRGRPVTICSSNTDQSACVTPASWRDGWLIFIPSNANGQWTAGDTIIKRQARNSMVESIAASNGTARPVLIYQATGLGRSLDQTFLLTPVAPVPSNSVRVVCVSFQGRAGLREKGVAGC